MRRRAGLTVAIVAMFAAGCAGGGSDIATRRPPATDTTQDSKESWFGATQQNELAGFFRAEGNYRDGLGKIDPTAPDAQAQLDQLVADVGRRAHRLRLALDQAKPPAPTRIDVQDFAHALDNLSAAADRWATGAGSSSGFGPAKIGVDRQLREIQNKGTFR